MNLGVTVLAIAGSGAMLIGCSPAPGDGMTGMPCEIGETMCKARCNQSLPAAKQQCLANCAVEHMCMPAGNMGGM